MGEVINLRMARKARERAEAEKRAQANRAKHGRKEAEKARDSAERERRERTLDGARIEDED